MKRFQRRRLLWWALVGLTGLGGLMAAVADPDTLLGRLPGHAYVPVSLRSLQPANYSADPKPTRNPPVSLNLIVDVLMDRGVDPTQANSRLKMVEVALLTPVPSATPAPSLADTPVVDSSPTSGPSATEEILPTATAVTPAAFPPGITATSSPDAGPGASSATPELVAIGRPTATPAASASRTSVPSATGAATRTRTPAPPTSTSALNPTQTSAPPATGTAAPSHTPAPPSATPTLAPSPTLSPAPATSTLPPSPTLSPATPTEISTLAPTRTPALPSQTPAPSPTASDTPAPAAIHVGGLDGSKADKSPPLWEATVTISVHDAAHAPVAGVTVSGSFSGQGSASCVTGGGGECSLTATNLKKDSEPSITFSVEGLSLAGYVYDSALNHASQITLTWP